MLTDKKTLAKLQRIEEQYEPLRFEALTQVRMSMAQTREHFRAEPKRKARLKWQEAKPGRKWGDSGITAWFRGNVKLPTSARGRKALLRAKTGGEALLFVDGRCRGVFGRFHPAVCLDRAAKPGKAYHIALETYAGHSFPGTQPYDSGPRVERNSRTFEGVEVVLERDDVSAFIFDLRALRQLVASLDDNSLRRARVAAGLAEVFALVSATPGELPEAEWRPPLARARDIMKSLLEAANGPTSPWIGIVGASHIDTAWLWPLAETWRKCARTFSSMVNLLEQYPELLFLQPAPCHADVVRREYPELFEDIKKLVAEGRWEPNGAMWIEPDCNMPSGEAFVRQLLLGQRATRGMFGYTADTLWLPDVFGYSAALPQILRGAGVDFFCTTKMAWNDTTRFPYDTFVWQGIDGSTVITHLNAHHSWPDPESLIGQWNWVQHKDIDDRRLCAFGFGDGGGGPMAEMAEMARRVQDLEGCPRAHYTTLSEFMRGIRDDIPNLPTWVGELYLELHRGTLTSIAGIKRGNRKAELALRDAEFLAALAGFHGASYPREELVDIWKEVLVNQFHDILPGSSIAQVNDEAIASLDRCIEHAECLSRDALRAIGGPKRARPGGLLVMNTLSWERNGEIEIPDPPKGLVPEGLDAQRITGPAGDARLVVGGISLPPLGGCVVPLGREEPAADESPFSLAGDTLTTPHAAITLDGSGVIPSWVDSASGREIVAPGGALNEFLLGEDVPQGWDNWDIDYDQAAKMKPAAQLVSREVASDGPLQIRVRSEYRLGRESTLVQDMVCHRDTPRVDFETVLDWAETRTLLKAQFGLAVHAESARHEIQYGHVERPTHENRPADRARFEVCAHKWTDLSENGFGVALLNESKYGVSAKGSTLGLTLLKSGIHPDDRGDAGRHAFTYALLPHACGFSVPAVVRPAYELNVAPLVHPVARSVSAPGSLAQVDADNVIIEAVKRAQDGEALVIRLYDAAKLGRTVRVSFGVPIRSVTEANLLEEPCARLKLVNGAVEFYVRPFEIKTLLCKL